MPHDPRRVVIAGAGVAGLEAMLALRRLAEERVAIHVIAPEREFTYRPLAVAEPFGAGEVAAFDLDELVREQGARFQRDRVVGIERSDRILRLGSGATAAYDDLVIACGGQPVAPLRGALCFTAPESGSELLQLLSELRAGAPKRVVFAVPAGPSWPLPLYELALMTAAHIAAHGNMGAEVALVTPEPEPLGIFGAAASQSITELLRSRRIEVVAGAQAVRVEPDALTTTSGRRLPADRVISIPRLAGTRIPGLPHDRDGFLSTNVHGQVRSAPNVFAAGDVVSFPVKQGGIAAQQADSVAHSIAVAAGAPVELQPFRPVLRGLLLTGGRARYLRAEIAGGHGDTSTATLEPLWWPPGKIAGRYLGPYLADRAGPEHPALAAEPDGLGVEVELPLVD